MHDTVNSVSDNRGSEVNILTRSTTRPDKLLENFRHLVEAVEILPIGQFHGDILP